MPPEKRFDFNKMKRRMVPKPEMGENVADVHYDMQTIEESQYVLYQIFQSVT